MRQLDFRVIRVNQLQVKLARLSMQGKRIVVPDGDRNESRLNARQSSVPSRRSLSRELCSLVCYSLTLCTFGSNIFAFHTA